MSSFEFIFSLFGLLLGFSLAEVLGGLVKTAKLKQKVRVGWLTPLLATFVLLDVLSFWVGAWSAREVVPMRYPTLVFGLAITGLYYMAASLVFPDSPEDWPDFDDYYLVHRRQVLIAVWLCNTAAFSAFYWLGGQAPPAMVMMLIGLYTILVAGAVLSGRKWVNIAALVGLIGIYASDVVANMSVSGSS